MPAPTTTSPSPSSSACCWPGSGRSCAATRPAKTPFPHRPLRIPAGRQGAVIDGGKKIRLTEKETAILETSIAPATRRSREELLAEVWGYNAGVTTHTLETHVYRLRQKIEPNPAAARILLTEAGGYKLMP